MSFRLWGPKFYHDFFVSAQGLFLFIEAIFNCNTIQILSPYMDFLRNDSTRMPHSWKF